MFSVGVTYQKRTDENHNVIAAGKQMSSIDARSTNTQEISQRIRFKKHVKFQNDNGLLSRN